MDPMHRCAPRSFLFMLNNSNSLEPSAFELKGFTDLTDITKTWRRQSSTARSKDPFLCGPVPMHWLYAAGSLPGKALQIAILLWHEVWCRRSRTIRFHISKTKNYGIHPDTARRALKALETSGLIRINHIPGQCSEIHILDKPSSAAKQVIGGTEVEEPQHALQQQSNDGHAPTPGGVKSAA